MPPPLALALCTVFVVALLTLEHKQNSSVSRALWIPTIWFLYSSSKPLGAWFQTEGLDIESGSPMDRDFLLFLLFVGLLILAWRKVNLSSFVRQNAWVIVLVAYMLFSILWSDLQYISFKRWTKELVAIIMAIVIFSEHNPRQAVHSIIKRSVYILIPFSLLLIKYFPTYGVLFGRWSGERMWIGVALQKNGLGRLCITAIIFLVWTLINRRQSREAPISRYQTLVEVALLLLSLYLLAGPRRTLGYSATATVSLAVGLLALGIILWIKKRGLIPSAKAVSVITLVIMVYGTITPMIGRLSFFDISSSFERDATLTGRSYIWGVLLPLAEKRPLLGYGFGGFWTTSVRELASSDAHNGYLDVILNLGFIGLLLVSGYMISCCHKFRIAIVEDFEWGSLFFCYLLLFLTHNISESSIDTLCSPLGAIILFFSISSFTLRTKGNDLEPSDRTDVQVKS
jgi:exopolysaccharide production protein ExoQ